MFFFIGSKAGRELEGVKIRREKECREQKTPEKTGKVKTKRSPLFRGNQVQKNNLKNKTTTIPHQQRTNGKGLRKG